jgi:hypothetical protein
MTRSRLTSSGSTMSVSSDDPRFEVMIRTTLAKSTVRPWPSVRRPSSITWSSTLNTSGCAFSTSSSSTTA